MNASTVTVRPSHSNPVLTIVVWVLLLCALPALCSCGALSLGNFKGLEKTHKDEKFYILKEAFLAGGTSLSPRTAFDHNMHETVSVFFTLNNERNHYVSKTIWYDPTGQEYRTIRQTHDGQQETRKGLDRDRKGTMRNHSMPIKQLYDHKRGAWKVELYIDDEMARRLPFTLN